MKILFRRLPSVSVLLADCCLLRCCTAVLSTVHPMYCVHSTADRAYGVYCTVKRYTVVYYFGSPFWVCPIPEYSGVYCYPNIRVAR